MMRRMMYLIVFVACAAPASAQMPPSIRKPIDAAKRQANKTSDQINDEQKVGNDQGAKAASMPAPVARSAASSTPQTGAATKGGGGARAAAADKQSPGADSSQRRGSVSMSGSKGSVTFYREVFTYDAAGRRDPFLSLMATGELRPMISDLTLVGIIYDPTGRSSVAILVDASAGGQSYRKKTGDILGLMKITRISENSITLNIDEFGLTRQETLLIDRSPRTGARRPQ